MTATPRDGFEAHFWLCSDPELPRSSSCAQELPAS